LFGKLFVYLLHHTVNNYIQYSKNPSTAMKQSIKLTIMLMALLLLPSSILAHDYEVDGIYYNIKDGYAAVTYQGTSMTQYKGEYSGDVTIPAVVTMDGTTYPVTTIEGFAFYGCPELTSITIPNSITSVYRYAFSGCNGLTRVDITDLAAWCNIYFETSDANPLDKAHHLFVNGSEVKNLEIPYSVTSIGQFAFAGCSAFTSIYLSLTEVIGDFAFSDCSGLSGAVIPETVSSIGRSIFSDCPNIEYLEVERTNPYYESPDFCSAIIEKATNTIVMGCKNTTIPYYVQTIGYGAFSGCTGLTSIDIPSSVATIAAYAFDSCTELSTINFSEGLTTVEKSAFSYCSSLDDVLFPNTLTSIGDFAFYECDALKSVSLGYSITDIGTHAFIYSSLSSINIPATVKSIGTGAFQECALTSIKVNSANQYYDSRDNCNAIIETASNKLLFGCQSTVIPNTVTAIEDYAFYNCNGLTTINIPNGVTSIGECAFCVSNNLTEVNSYITDLSAVSVGDQAFYRYPNTYDNRTLRVPYATASAYQSNSHWGPYFGNIVEMESEPSTSIELDQTVAEVVEGGTITLKATVTPLNAANNPLAWTSSNTSVATVNNEGLVTALCVGKTTITATTTDGTELSASCELTVKSETGNNYFEMSDIYVHPGDTVSIPVRMINADPVTWFMTDICLPDGFTVPTHINDFNGYRGYDVFPSDRFTDDHYIMTALLNDSTVRVFGNNFSDLPFIGNDGELFYITVIVPEVTDGYYTIHLRNSELTFVEGFERIPVAGAVINIVTSMQGDINGDGKLAISDVTALINILLTEDTSSGACDVNGDGKVSIADVTFIINMLLSQN